MSTAAGMLLRRLRRHGWLYGPQRAPQAGVPLVRVRCAACGIVAAVIEEHRGALRARAGRVMSAYLDGVACPAHGRLAVTWEALEPGMAAGRAARRPATVRAGPASMP